MKKRFEEYFRVAEVSIDILCNSFIKDKIMQYYIDNMAIMMIAHDHCYAVLKRNNDDHLFLKLMFPITTINEVMIIILKLTYPLYCLSERNNYMVHPERRINDI